MKNKISLTKILENLLNVIYNNSLYKKWKNFLNVILDPWVIILSLATVYFIYFSNLPGTTDKNIISILTLIISLFSAILGGILANRWAEITELKVLVARGKSAIRSLKLILLNISKIEKRTKYYISSIDKENEDFKLVISNFEEVIEKCYILEEEIISSIENWTDIIPEVENMKTQIGLITDMINTESLLQQEILGLNKNLETEKEKKGKQNNDMQNLLKEKEAELTEVKRKLTIADNKFNETVLSGLTPSSSFSNLNEKIIFTGSGTSGSSFLNPNKLHNTIYGIGSAAASENSFIITEPLNKTVATDKPKKTYVKMPKQ